MAEKKQIPMAARGIDLNSAPDQLEPGYFQVLDNVRRLTDDSIEPRHGLGTGSPVISAQTPAHSVRRLNDSSSGSINSTLVVGAGTHLGICSTNLSSSSSSDTGFSGDPLSICIHRPTQSTKPWAYVADRSRMRKIDQAGTDKQIGLPAPTAPPSDVELYPPAVKVLDEFNDHTLWTAGGTAGGKANHTRINSATRTVTAILYYGSLINGWAVVRPSSMADIGEGMRITVDAETTTVQEVHRGSTATTIASIIYESGVSGLCSIYLTAAVEEIEINSMMLLGGSEYVRVESIHRTTDGWTSFRCRTVGTFAATDSAELVSSFVAYFTGTHTAGDAISAAAVEFTVSAGTGHISRTVALDLSQISSGLPTRPEDFMHLDLYVDKPDLVSEIKVYLDIDISSNTFDRNYMLYVLRSNDLTPVTKDEQTMIAYRQINAQRTKIDKLDNQLGEEFSVDEKQRAVADLTMTEEEEKKAKDAAQRQLDAGQNQWTSSRWRISQLTNTEEGRIGSDRSRGLKDVAALRISVIATGNVTVRVDGWWIGGGYGPDVTAAGRPRTYRYRGLDSTTGAVSNWSPAFMGGVLPRRQRVSILFNAHPSSECDKLEVQAYGGDRLGWCYLETVSNSGLITLDDVYSDEDLELRKSVSEQSNDRYQLWPQLRPPNTGGNCNISGNLVSLTSGTINASTAIGTNFRAGKHNYTIRQILSTTKLYIDESAGNVSGAAWDIPEPLITGQPLAILAGPFFGFLLGCGDPYNPWRYYYTNGNDGDSTRDTHYGDIENQILQNIIVLEDMGRAIILAADGVFALEPSFTLARSGGNLFAARQLPDAPGLFAQWACCDADGEAIWLAKDGIYATAGGGTRCISDKLRPIFPKGNSLGVTTNGIVAPSMTAGNETKLRLSYSNRELFFDYLGIDGNQHTLVNERDADGQWLGWIPHNYSPGIVLHYGEEGENVRGTLALGTDGKIYRMATGQGDAGASFIAKWTTPDHHFGDARRIKHMMEGVIDCDRDGATVSVVVGINHRATTPDSLTINSGSGRSQRIIDLDSGRGRDAKDISIAVSSTVTTERPKFYLYELYYSMRFDTTLLRAGDYELKQEGVIWCRGIWIYADTYGASRTAEFEFTKDDGTTGAVTISSINHAELTERYYDLETPQYISAGRVRPTDAGEWEFVGYRLEGEPAPAKSDGPTKWLLDGMQARLVQGVKFDIDTENASIDMATIVDENITQTTISSAAHKGPVLSNGRAIKHFSFDEPFITHLIRFNPSAACRIFGVEVISEPEPELAYMWWTQQTDLGAPGFKFLGDGYISIRSTSNIVLEIIADGTTYTVTFFDASTNTSGARRKLRFRCPPIKAKSFEFKVYAATAAGRVAIYQKELQIEFKPFGFEGGWQTINPLGDIHYQNGARI